MKTCLKVDINNARTPSEEYEYLWQLLSNRIEELPIDMHPNEIRASKIYKDRIHKKIRALIQSEDFKENGCF